MSCPKCGNTEFGTVNPLDNPANWQRICQGDHGCFYVGGAAEWIDDAEPLIDPAILARVRTELAFAEGKKYLAVPIDIADLKALLAAAGGEA